MIINGKALLQANPVAPMRTSKERAHGVSYGLTEAGYDIRIKQRIAFDPEHTQFQVNDEPIQKGRFVLASTIEHFTMPDDLVGVVHDKSTWARKGLSVFNTVLEPKWDGFLTLELVYHGSEPLVIPAGAGIAQILFHKLDSKAAYTGKYQGQADAPIPAKFE